MSKQLEKMSELQSRVFMLLPLGADNSISTQEIEDILGIEKRYIMEIVQTLVLDYGIPIGSFRNQNNGYFIATNEEEKRIGTHSLAEQSKALTIRLKKVKEADFETTILYRKEYKEKARQHNKQLDIYDCLNLADDSD